MIATDVSQSSSTPRHPTNAFILQCKAAGGSAPNPYISFLLAGVAKSQHKLSTLVSELVISYGSVTLVVLIFTYCTLRILDIFWHNITHNRFTSYYVSDIL